jgi:protoporphyrinogen oxidase
MKKKKKKLSQMWLCKKKKYNLLDMIHGLRSLIKAVSSKFAAGIYMEIRKINDR